MKRLTKAVAAVLLLAGATVSVRAYLTAQKDDSFEVKTAPITHGLVAAEVSATGNLQAVTTVQVGTQISGTISWLGADFNSIVRKGQVIARLDPLLMETQVAQARAGLTRASAEAENAKVQLKSAEQKHARLSALWTKELISQNEFDGATLAVALGEAQEKSAAAQVTQAAAALRQSEVALTHTVITAPIDGIVIQRSVDVGQTVSASISSPTIFAIAADLGRMQVNAGVDESDIGRIRPSQNVRFAVDAHPGETFEGMVTQVRLEPTLLQNVITYNAIIAVPNPDLKLRPGMTANVKIQIASRDDVVRIPNAALRFRPTAAMYAAIGQAPPSSTDIRRRAASGEGTPALEMIGEGEEGDPLPVRPSPARNPDATTIDALFAPLSNAASEGRVWLYENGRLTSVPVRLGITDGQMTELLEGDLQPDTQLVTNISVGAVRSALPASTPSTGGFFLSAPAGGSGRQGGAGTRSSRG